jgi:hypothetical protein
MSRTRLPLSFTAGRVATVSAAFLLTLGATGAADVAFADGAPPVPAVSGSPAAGTGEDGAAYVLTNNGSGNFNLAITVPGTSISIDYTVDPTGAVTAASTSTAGATVTSDGHELNVTLADGRTVQVEIGDGGDTVEQVETDAPDNSDAADPQDTPDNSDSQGDESSSNDNQSDDSGETPATTETDAPDSSDSSDNSTDTDSSDTGSSDTGTVGND